MDRAGERGNPVALHGNGGTGIKAVVCCRYDPPDIREVVELVSQADDLLTCDNSSLYSAASPCIMAVVSTHLSRLHMLSNDTSLDWS